MKYIIWISLLSLLLVSCDTKQKSISAGDRSRRLAYRETLKQKLGDLYHKPVQEASSLQLDRGAQLYSQLCASCHGGRGEGNGHAGETLLSNPSNLTDEQEARFYSEQARLHIIRNGVPGTAMMGWQGVLPEEDILAVYLYIRFLLNTE